jgi:hypothetical protein
MSNVVPYYTKTFTKFIVYDGDSDDDMDSLPPTVRYAPIQQGDSDSDFDPE